MGCTELGASRTVGTDDNTNKKWHTVVATAAELGLAGEQGRKLVRMPATGVVMTEVKLASCGKAANFHL
jgi:hypothetical protein